MGANQTTEELIKEIAASQPACVDKHIEDLFNIYDRDKSGDIAGFEWNRVLADIVRYLLENNLKGKDVNPGRVSAFVTDVLDVNRDGHISKSEFIARFKKCLLIKIE